MKGKEKCKALKEIRRQIAEENDIPYVVSQCTYQGDCKGTCPKCESELRYLERELAIRQGLGKAVAVVGISASVCGGLTACSPMEVIRDGLGIGTVETAGNMAMPEQEIELEGDTDLPDLEENFESGPDGTEKLPGEGPEAESGDTSLPGEGGESQSVDEALAGAIPPSEEDTSVGELEGDIALPEEESVMGEVLPLPELEGDVALPEEEPGYSDESAPSSGEAAQ